jgi:hypothetical protein
MRNIIIGLAAIGALSAAPALAQSSSTITVNGTIASGCTAVTIPNSANLGTISTTTGVGELDVAKVNVALTGTSASVTCNGAGTTLTVTALPLTGPALPNGTPTGVNGFTNTIDYTANVSKPAGSYVQSLGTVAGIIMSDATTTGATTETVGLVASNLNIDITNAAAIGTLIAGAYTGTVQISLTPGS